jgi:ribosomal protein S18 acetylase RimI-like enzyme
MGTVTAISQRRGKLTSPMPLRQGHDAFSFDCGRLIMNDWLKDLAWKNSEGNSTRTYVVCRGTKKVVAYYALSVGAVDRDEAPSILSRNCPNPIPVIVLARLAVDKSEGSQGIGRALLSNGMKRAAQAARIIGARALIVQPLDEKAIAFYEHFDFRWLSKETQKMFITMKTIQQEMGL